jgi:transcriptional regulator with XRE-family HTH domain
MTEKSSDALPGEPEADPVLVELGRRLLRARLRYGERLDPPKSVSQAAIARLIDVTGVTVGAWEAGKNDPGLSMLNRLAELYGVRLVWLLTGLGDMYGEGDQGAPTNGAPIIGPTVHTTPVVQSSRLDDPPAPQGKPVRRPRGRSAVA